MDKASVKETLNGANNEKYITPFTLNKALGNSGSGGGTPTTVTVKVNSTTTLEPNNSAEVTNSGDDVNVKLNFKIPKGAKGDTGPKGDTGDTGPQGPKGDDGVVIEANGVVYFEVDANGDLILHYDGTTYQNYNIDANGDLIVTL